MLSQILKTSVFVLLLAISCKQGIANSQNVSENQNIQKFNDTVISIIHNKDYYLKIETHLFNDTLDVVDYKEDKYSSPIITHQILSFYNNKKLIKNYKLPLENINKKTVTGRVLGIAETPIYKMCTSNNFYIIQGSDYCNGSDCPEFIGIYEMNGTVVCEWFSNKKDKTSLKGILFKNRIDLNKLTDCVNIEVFN
jgi:hypothetical protein